VLFSKSARTIVSFSVSVAERDQASHLGQSEVQDLGVAA
jgi:hypothetical protein